MEDKVLVVFSGGLDSSVLLYKAVSKYGKFNVYALNISYGQKHIKEQEYAEWTAKHIWKDDVDKHLLRLDVSNIFDFNKNCCSLLQGSALSIPHKSYEKQLEGRTTPVSTYVPFRNGLFLSIATSVAYQLGCQYVAYGAHLDDAAGNAYPDCSPEFNTALNTAVETGTGNQVHIYAPYLKKKFSKKEVVAYGIAAGMTHEEFEHTWSCYEGTDEPCGICGTCRDRKLAFEANDIFDIK